MLINGLGPTILIIEEPAQLIGFDLERPLKSAYGPGVVFPAI